MMYLKNNIKYLLIMYIVLCAASVYAADMKISDLATDTTPDGDSLLILVDDPSGAATNVNTSVTNMITATVNSLDTSAEIRTEVSDETGTGALCFATSPTLVTPSLGTISSGVGTALTALNGENIQNDTIDDDSIDFADVTCADLDMSDCGAITGNVTGNCSGSSGSCTGNAATATALAANGGNCAAGEYPLGVDASGAIESCTDATTEINSVVNGAGGANLTCAAQTCNVDDAFIVNDADDATSGWLTVAGLTSSERISLATGKNLVVGTTQWDNGSDGIDGEQIADDTIDNDSVDWGDMTDLTTDGAVVWGNIAAGELTDDSVNNADVNWPDIDYLADEGTLLSGTDPDVGNLAAVTLDTDGANETTDASLRGYDGVNQYAFARKLKCLHWTVAGPNSLDDATRDKFPIWSNETGMTFTVTKIKAWAQKDATAFDVEVYDSDGASNNATVDSINCTTGSGPYTDTETVITAGAITASEFMTIDFSDTAVPNWVKGTICGWLNADVD